MKPIFSFVTIYYSTILQDGVLTEQKFDSYTCNAYAKYTMQYSQTMIWLLLSTSANDDLQASIFLESSREQWKS